MDGADKGFAFVRSFLVCLFGILLPYLLVVKVVDPYRCFGGHWFPNTRTAVRADKVRLLETYLKHGPVTGLILGSSRVMQLHPAEFDSLLGKRFFNAGVFDASPEDYLAMYRVLIRHGARPEVVVIGVDLEHLDDRPFDVEMDANYEMRSAIDDSIRGPVGFLINRVETYKNKALSFITVSDILLSIKMSLRPVPPAYALAPDGGMTPYIKPDNDAIESGRLLLREMPHPNPRRMALLETLIREAQAMRAKVIMFVTPYRPDALAVFRSDPVACKDLLAAADYVRSLGPRFGISDHDYTDEASFDGLPAAWGDSAHYTGENTSRLARKVIADAF